MAIKNRIFEEGKENEKQNYFMCKIENEPVPTNEYLSYELSQ